MNGRNTVFLAAFVLGLPRYALSQPVGPPEARIDRLFSSYGAQTPGAAVAVMKDGGIVFMKGYGMADLEQDRPITPQSVFNIASVSKQFTAFTIYLLAEEKRISLDDDIRKYLPEVPDYGQVIRIKHLLAHTSGLRDEGALASLAGRRRGDVVTTEEIMKLAARQRRLNFAPGTQFGYSNTGYTFLAEIVRRASGKTFAAYADEKIFRPLGMLSTRFEDNHEIVVKNRAGSYERFGQTYHRRPLNSSNAGPSNLLTTVEDLTRWVRNFETPVVGSRELLRAFNEVSHLDNGEKVVVRVLGPGDTIFHAKGQNVSTYKGLRMISHGGHAAAFRTFLGRFPDQRFAVIALSNDEHNENLNARWQIADFYLADVQRDEPEAAPRPPRPPTGAATTYRTALASFSGEYESGEIVTTYRVEARGDHLDLVHMRLSDIRLARIGENRFAVSGPQPFPVQIEFRRNASGVFDRFDLSNFGVTALPFVRVRGSGVRGSHEQTP